MADESREDRHNRELIELLNELRVALPGVQVLFAFLLIVPFSNGFPKLGKLDRDIFYVAFIATALSTVLLIAPSSYHRLRFRHGNKEHMVRVGNRFSIAGIAASAVSLEAVVLLVMDYVLSLEAAIAAAASLFAVVALLWYGLPLFAAIRDRRAR